MKFRSLLIFSIMFGGAAAGYDAYTSAVAKFDQIASDRLRPGARLSISPAELNAYAAHAAPAGVRQTRVEIPAPGVARGSAMVDFAKLDSGAGHAPGFLTAMLLGGERPVSVTARIHSADGRAQVDLEKVEIGGMDIEGGTLDFLIQNFLLPLYPSAAVGRPFELGHHIQKLDVQPGAVGVWIGR